MWGITLNAKWQIYVDAIMWFMSSNNVYTHNKTGEQPVLVGE